jgi:hypothetical protein
MFDLVDPFATYYFSSLRNFYKSQTWLVLESRLEGVE